MRHHNKSASKEIAELESLGIDPKRVNDLNDKVELNELADNIKQSMFQDYKTAYAKNGEKYEEEAKATIS